MFFWIIFSLNFLTLFLSASPNMMHFVRTFSVMRARRKDYRYQRDSNLWKSCMHPRIFENGWWEDAYSSSYPWVPPWPWATENHQKSQAYFSHLAPLVLIFFTKKQSQKGGAWPNVPYLLNTLLALSTHNQKCANKMHCIFLYLIAYLSSYHEKAINAQ